jgi:enoyl-CoA hydratase/carnithine racemase
MAGDGTDARKFFSIQTDTQGITTITLNRPPVNAISVAIYPEMRRIANMIMSTEETRVVILTAPPNARAWCGGAELSEFVDLDYDARLARYDVINEYMPSLYNLDRPVIAAINKHAVGVGMVLASFCDIRIASEDAFFAVPEIDRGVLAGAGGFFMRLNMPQGKIREMIFTGRRFMAEELRETGFLNYIVPADQVMPKAREIAEIIAKKSLPALKANKRTMNAGETLTWKEAYKMTQTESARLTDSKDAKEGIRAFLEKRPPNYADR